MLACRAIVGLAAAVAAAFATPAIAAGQGLSDRIALCTPRAEARARVRELSAALTRVERSPEASFDLHTARGRARTETCDFEGALTDFDRALRVKPQRLPLNANFYIGRADAYLRLERRDQALADYAAALALTPGADDKAHIHQMRGFIHTDSGDEISAIQEFSQVIVLRPDFADAYWFRAVSYENINDYASALADYERMARLWPDDWTGWSQVCWGHAYANSRLEDGLRACDTALRLNPGDPNTLDGRGFVNFRLGRFLDAVADYDRALAQTPRLPASLFLRGLAKARLGDATAAASDVSAAERLEPGIKERFAGYGIRIMP